MHKTYDLMLRFQEKVMVVLVTVINYPSPTLTGGIPRSSQLVEYCKALQNTVARHVPFFTASLWIVCECFMAFPHYH
jgi:hypothetical protein